MFRARPWVWLVVVPILLQWPDLSGWLSADPIYLESGLTRDWRPNGVLPGLPGWIDGNAGVTLEALGRQAAHDWRRGIIPWWNPYAGVGLPLAGEMQPAAFFLPFVLLLGVNDGILYLKIVLQIIAGLATWRLLKELKLSPLASLLGGILFQLNGTFAWDSDSASLPVAFLPVTLLGLERAFAAARLRAPGGWRLLCAGLAYGVLAGFPEVAFIDGLLAFAWAALRFFQAGEARLAFFRRVLTGGIVALMGCAPLLLAFVSFLGQMDLGQRNFSHARLAPGNLAMMLFPYVNGPIFFHDLFDMWYTVGGFVGLPVLCMALAAIGFALWSKPKNLGVRSLLAAWMLLSLAKAMNVPGITAAWNLIPMITHAGFPRYADASWEFCAIVLAAMAMDDLGALGARARRLGVGFAAGLGALAAGGAFLAGRDVLRGVAGVPTGEVWISASLGWGFLVAALLMAAAAARRFRPALPATLLVLDAALQFSVPLLAGTRGEARTLDLASVGFLKDHIGLGRYYTLGPFTANYGGYYGVAEINHNYAPLPDAWPNYVHAHLDPLAGTVAFTGSYPGAADGQETRMEAVRRRYPAFAAIGVKYVLTIPGVDPFAMAPAWLHAPTSVQSVIMQPGQEISGSFPSGTYDPGEVGSAGLPVATFGGRSTGRLAIHLCAGSFCVDGSAGLDGKGEGSTLVFPLGGTLHVGPADTVRFVIAHQGGSTPVAVLVWRDALPPRGEVFGPEAIPPAHVPDLLLWAPAGAARPRLAYRGKVMDIYELPDVAPYFEAPGCTLSFGGRTRLRARCAGPAHLLRRELYFPGWRASVNGAPVAVRQAGLFQEIELPSGPSQVRFSFAPPYAGWGYAAAALGALRFAWFGRGRRGLQSARPTAQS